MRLSEHHERENRGSPDFPISYYGVNAWHPRYVMPLHWHLEFELMKVKKGKVLLYLNNEETEVNAGESALVSCGVLHRAEPDSGAEYDSVVFDLKMLCVKGGKIAAFILPIVNGDLALKKAKFLEGDEVTKCVENVCDELRDRRDFFELRVYSELSRLFYELYQTGCVTNYDKNTKTGQRRRMISELLEYIEQNYTERITLDELAKVSGTNEKYLCRFFKEFTGYAPIDYINRLRIERACQQISVENCNVITAAYDAGFNDNSYFSKIFKRYKGITPMEYKKICEKNKE